MSGFEQVWAQALFGRPKPLRALSELVVKNAPEVTAALDFIHRQEAATEGWGGVIVVADREVLLEEIRVLRSIIAEIEDAKRVSDPEPDFLKKYSGVVRAWNESAIAAQTAKSAEIFAHAAANSEPGLPPGAAIARALRFG